MARKVAIAIFGAVALWTIVVCGISGFTPDKPGSAKHAPAYVDLREVHGAVQTRMVLGGGFFPVLVEARTGEILAVVRGGGVGHLGPGRLDALHSMDGGLTWSRPVTIVDSPRDDRNPAVGLTANGKVVVAYLVVAKSYADGAPGQETYLTRSSDGGHTWEKPYRLSFALLNGYSPYGRIVTLKDGIMLLPIHGPAKQGIIPNDARQYHGEEASYLLRSNDGGLTWSDPSLIVTGYDETALLALPNDDLLAAIREGESQDDFQAVDITRSGDGGYSWCKPKRLTNRYEHPVDLALLSAGQVLMVFGVRHQPWGVQGLLNSDGGRTWETSRRLLFADDLPRRDPDRFPRKPPSPGFDCGYPSTLRLRDGRMVTAYYDNLLREDLSDGRLAAAYCLSYRELELLQAWHQLK